MRNTENLRCSTVFENKLSKTIEKTMLLLFVIVFALFFIVFHCLSLFSWPALAQAGGLAC